MSVKIFGLDEVTKGLQRTGERTSKRQLKLVRDYAQIIADEAKTLAPVDQGDLEKAIKVVGEDRMGTRRNIIMVGVDVNELGDGYKKDDFRYDIWTHEFDYKLGDESIKKAERTGKVIGPKYLERAAKMYEGEIVAGLERIAYEEANR